MWRNLVAGTTRRERERNFNVFHFGFPLGKEEKKQSRHRVFPKQLPSGLDVRVYSSLCGCDAALYERMTRGVALWEKKGPLSLSLSPFFILFFWLYKNKMRHIQKFIWWRCHSVRRIGPIYNPPPQCLSSFFTSGGWFSLFLEISQSEFFFFLINRIQHEFVQPIGKY